MMNYQKYSKGYFMPPEIDLEWAKKDAPDKAPIWCSVDMRDGNQALIIPMNLDEKLEFYKMLLKVGFKEIEVGFPAASETEYEFLRRLVEDDLIPDDVTIQVLTQAREHIIRKTFDALKGVKNAIVHVYNSTSVAQRQQVFRKSKDEIKQMAVDGAKLLKKLTEEAGANYRFEYSPESFTGTEPEYALEVCNAVLDVWQPTADRKAIINLPVTVEMSMPHVYAMQVAYMNKHLKYRDNVVLSLHPHNDRGCGVADTEMGILAGADRVEGTLFGNGERTGNVDIVTVGMNMFALGVDPELDFSNMSELVDTYERLTRMKVGYRQPYAGKLVFAAFSGSHQDAIAKGKERDRLNSLLGGIKEMRKRPDAIVVVDSNWEHNAVHEAKLLHIHTFGLIDTNCEPSDVEFPIPVNVDGPESVKLIIGLLADAVVAAKGGEAAYAYQADAADAGNMESFIPEDLSKYQFSQDDLKVVHAKIREDIFAAKRKGKKRRKKASKKFVKRPNGGNRGPKDENRGEKAQEAPKATEAAPSEKTEAKPATEETK